jgi:hypothetical protein
MLTLASALVATALVAAASANLRGDQAATGTPNFPTGAQSCTSTSCSWDVSGQHIVVSHDFHSTEAGGTHAHCAIDNSKSTGTANTPGGITVCECMCYNDAAKDAAPKHHNAAGGLIAESV